VSLEGSARKLITVRSALTVSNRLPQPVRIRLENTALKIGGWRVCTVLVISRHCIAVLLPCPLGNLDCDVYTKNYIHQSTK
jgi:hypothetical protein